MEMISVERIKEVAIDQINGWFADEVKEKQKRDLYEIGSSIYDMYDKDCWASHSMALAIYLNCRSLGINLDKEFPVFAKL